MITGKKFDRAWVDEVISKAPLHWEPKDIPIDKTTYLLLRDMTIVRTAMWATDSVILSIKHKSGQQSRKIEVAREDAVNDTVMARLVSDLCRELETEMKVYRMLEEKG